MSNYRGGKGPALGDPSQLRLRDYFTTGADGGNTDGGPLEDLGKELAKLLGLEHKSSRNSSDDGDSSSDSDIPDEFGLDDLPDKWGVQGNDKTNDCVQAGFIHEVMLWTKKATGDTTKFDSDAALKLYEEWTGYDPDDDSTDKGTMLKKAIKKRYKHGIKDKDGDTHRISGYAGVTLRDPDELAAAVYEFGCVGVGVQFPKAWMVDFNNGDTWNTVSDDEPEILFGHYVPVIGRKANGNFVTVSWGKLQEMTPEGYKQFNDETVAYITFDYLDDDKETPRGIDRDRLKADLEKLDDDQDWMSDSEL